MGSNNHKLSLSLVLLLSSWVFMGYSQDELAGLLSSLTSVAGGEGGAGGLAGGIPLGAASSMACAQKIMPCQAFLKPPSAPTDACCSPLKQLIHDDPKCLCNIFNNEEMLKTFGVSQHDALKLLIDCDTKADIRQCNNTAPSPAGSATPAAPLPKTSETSTSTSTGTSESEGAAVASLLSALNSTNGTNPPAPPASDNSARSEKMSLFGGFGFIALFTSLYLSA